MKYPYGSIVSLLMALILAAVAGWIAAASRTAIWIIPAAGSVIQASLTVYQLTRLWRFMERYSR